jgi:hypothetical protein
MADLATGNRRARLSERGHVLTMLGREDGRN